METMELERVKKIIEETKTNKIYHEWENMINAAFHIDSGMFLDSEFFEILKIENKKQVLNLIDMLKEKAKEIKAS